MAPCLQSLKQTSIRSFCTSIPLPDPPQSFAADLISSPNLCEEAAVVRECHSSTLDCSHVNKLETFSRDSRSSCQLEHCDKDLAADPGHVSTATELTTPVLTYQRQKERKDILARDAFEIKNQAQTYRFFKSAFTGGPNKEPTISSGTGSYKKYSGSLIRHQIQSHRRRICGQYFIDLGQADFSYSTCRICGLLYACGHEEDDKLHASFHKTYLQGIQFKGWLHERVVMRYNKNDDRIILVLPTDPPHHQHKVKEVTRFMEKQLGFIPGWLLHSKCKVYLLISLKKVVGCVVTESIKEAFPVHLDEEQAGNKVLENYISGVADIQLDKMPIFGSESTKLSGGEDVFWTQQEGYYPQGENTTQSNQDGCTEGFVKQDFRVLTFGNVKFKQEVQKRFKIQDHPTTFGQAMICSKIPVCAVCGVRGIWVSQPERRKGIATKLLDAMRATFFYGFVVDSSQCAFTQPTSDGKAFAAKYFKTDSFLVYS